MRVVLPLHPRYSKMTTECATTGPIGISGSGVPLFSVAWAGFFHWGSRYALRLDGQPGSPYMRCAFLITLESLASTHVRTPPPRAHELTRRHSDTHTLAHYVILCRRWVANSQIAANVVLLLTRTTFGKHSTAARNVHPSPFFCPVIPLHFPL